MINNLFVLSAHHAVSRGYTFPQLQANNYAQPRFGREYDHYDRRVQSAKTIPEKLNSMAEKFIATTMPDLSLTLVEDLTPKNLKDLGDIKGIIFDLDDTLMPILSGKFPENVIKTLKHLQKAGYKMGVVTNNMQPAYCRNARELLRKEGLDLPFIEDAHKPDPRGFIAMQSHLGIPAHQLAVVGDGYICDMRCANLVGMKTVQAGWFNPGKIATTASYTLDTVAAMIQTIRNSLLNKPEPTIIDAKFDERTDRAFPKFA